VTWTYYISAFVIAFLFITMSDDGDDDQDGGMMVPAYQQRQ
jgi:hypothetical protein